MIWPPSGRLAELGPFFAAEAHDPRRAPDPPWRPMGELLDDPAVLDERVRAVRAHLAAAGGLDAAAIEPRVAASITHLGLAARTLSPLLALAVLYGRTRPVSLRDLRWQPLPPSTFPLSIAALDDAGDAAEPGTGPDVLARALADGAVRTAGAELCAAVRRFGVSERVLWGNVASALNGARAALAAAAPHEAPRAAAVVAHLLRHPALAGTALTGPGSRFRRRSCCLIYRAAPGRDGPLCGDCVLLTTSRATRDVR